MLGLMGDFVVRDLGNIFWRMVTSLLLLMILRKLSSPNVPNDLNDPNKPNAHK